MKFKKKLLELKDMLLLSDLSNVKAFEFDALLENHPIGNQNIYRLYYVNYHRIGESYVTSSDNVGMINWCCKPFMFPEGMTREEGFKVLSYLTDFIERRNDIEAYSLKSVRTLDSVLYLERFGFTRVDEKDENKILNLFTVDGRLLLFKKSQLYAKYFEWYIENVTLEEVVSIYSKCNRKFEDIIWYDKPKDTEKVLKQIKKS